MYKEIGTISLTSQQSQTHTHNTTRLKQKIQSETLPGTHKHTRWTVLLLTGNTDNALSDKWHYIGFLLKNSSHSGRKCI